MPLALSTTRAEAEARLSIAASTLVPAPDIEAPEASTRFVASRMAARVLSTSSPPERCSSRAVELSDSSRETSAIRTAMASKASRARVEEDEATWMALPISEALLAIDLDCDWTFSARTRISWAKTAASRERPSSSEVPRAPISDEAEA